MIKLINNLLEEHNTFFSVYLEQNSQAIARAAREIAGTFLSGNKLYICGSTASGHTAAYAAQQFVLPGRMQRPPFPAMTLSSDITFAGDIPEEIYERQIASCGSPGDVLWGIAAEGRSPSVEKAMFHAAKSGMKTIGLTGGKGAFQGMCDVHINASGPDRQRRQEAHIFTIHTICDMVEKIIFEPALDGEENENA